MLVRQQPSLSRGRGMLAGTLLVSCPVGGQKAWAELHCAAACFTHVLSRCASCLEEGPPASSG